MIPTWPAKIIGSSFSKAVLQVGEGILISDKRNFFTNYIHHTYVVHNQKAFFFYRAMGKYFQKKKLSNIWIRFQLL